jgi:hypothetical protein
MGQIKRGIHNSRVIKIVLPASNQQDLEIGIGFGKSSSRDTSSSSATGEDDVHVTIEVL